MKRDIDLCRQLLFDIEAQGAAECTASVLRGSLTHDTDARVRFHLRLMIDAGLVKEVQRTTSGSACLRLTHTGAELLELCRSDARWREAKTVVQDRTGGLSLTAIRTLLTKWAVESSTYGYARAPRRTYRPYYRREEPVRYNTEYREPERVEVEDELRLIRTMPDYRERLEWFDYDYYYDRTPVETKTTEPSVQLPIYLV
ncbi:DUF2513 domain-containing protein [Aeoliella mucimassa]|uniref:Uncharacterized protein n=1 Tax=Aeoliella mucimassa TaxID=2527972 RepID=A0A518AUP9_9BACT|nr:DUF2513 domain-containing protein [Aeoliella mucimassa]QDU58442.1 hypothetical protein Pan181_46780 [Aeoliella mucimassa]